MRKEQTPPDVAELNQIQAEWMKLDPHAPEPERKRVLKIMERYPRRYLSGHDGFAIAIIDGTPMHAKPVPLAEALATVKRLGGRIDVAWNGTKGEWYQL